MKGLNSSFDGLFSKIEAIKEQHSVRPKNDTSFKETRFNGFPKFGPDISTPKPSPTKKPFELIK